MRSIALIIASAALAFVQAASAQDVPSRVGRLAYTQGAVSVYQDPELGWDKAYVNTPITSENSVWTDRGARAEMRAGGTAVRLDSETQLDVSRLEENDFDATIQRGSANVRVRYKERGDRITFSTPHALFMLETDGRYRIDVDEDRDESRLTVFGGYANMETSSGRVPVEPGRTVIVSGGGQYAMDRARENGFDRWAAVRDQQWQDSSSRRYVSSDMTGYEELDRYGSWNQDPDYGAVWYPTRVTSNWAPYRDGHWTYVRPWGWTWVDDAPWGYAPSHYGRWVQVRDRWGWVPGGVRERPVWAPAVVGWIGGLSIGASSAPVSWYPLAPWERYDPWYRTNSAYNTRVNRVVVDRQPRWWQGRGDDWRHWNRERASTVVNRDVFVNRHPVQNSFTRGNAEAIRQAPVVSGAQVAQQVLPQRNELLRYREANRVNVAAPTVMRQPPQQVQQQQQQQQQPQRQEAGQVVRPDFRRRGAPPVVAPAPAGQPQFSAPAPQAAQPQQQQQQPQNPAARGDRGQQRQAEEEARTRAQQQQQQQRASDAQRQQQEQAQRQQQEQAQRQQQEQSQRAGREQQQQRQQQEAQRAAQEQAQRQQQEQAQRQQQEQAQRQQQEQAQRAAREQQDRAQRDAQGREAMAREQQQRDAQQRAARDAQQQQERAQREAQQQQSQAAQQQRQQQEAAQRGAQEQQQRAQQQQRQQQEAAQRAAQEQAQRAQQQQQQAQERARREAPQPQPQPQAQPQQQPQAQPQQQQQQQANPAARGDRGNRDQRAREEKDKKDKEEKDKDKR